MKKILFLFLLLSSLLNASYLYDKNYPLCIEDFYVKGGSLYYLRSSDNVWSSTSEDNTVGFIYSGYDWDIDNSACVPTNWLILGMSVEDFYFLLALTGLLFGFVFMFFSIYIFINVGGRK